MKAGLQMYVWPLGLSLAILVFALAAFDGYYMYDDYSYAYYAYKLRQGDWLLNEDIFTHRWGLIVPQALLYGLLGTGHTANMLLPLLSTLVTLWLLFVFLKKEYPEQAAAAATLFAGTFYVLFFANKLYPDPLLMPLALGAALCLWKRKQHFGQGALFALLNAWAFLTKELIVYFFPFYLLCLLHDVWRREQGRFWAGALLTALLLGGSYLWLYELRVGEALYRFRVIEEGHYASNLSYFDKDLPQVLQRLTFAPLVMMVNTGLWLLFVPMALGLRRVFGKKNSEKHPQPLLEKEESIKSERFAYQGQSYLQNLFWEYLALSSLLCFWWGTTSLRFYSPIGLLPRMILFFLPVWAIVAARFWQQPGAWRATAWGWALGGVAAWWTISPKYTLLYGLLALAAWGLAGRYRAYLHGVLLLLLAVQPLYHLYKGTQTGYREEEALLKELAALPKLKRLYTDERLYLGYALYFDFEPPADLEVRPFEQQVPQGSYLLLNGHSIEYYSTLGVVFPDYVLHPDGYARKIAQKGSVALYRVGEE